MKEALVMDYICVECGKVIDTGQWDFAFPEWMSIYHTSCWKKRQERSVKEDSTEKHSPKG